MDFKVALITGSSSGIGAATAKLFAKKGFKVVVTGSNEDRVNKVAAECNRLSPHGYQALALVVDLTKPTNGEVLVQKTIEHFKTLDVLVNNAGIFSRTQAADKASFDVYKRVMAVNCESVIKTTMEAIPHLEQSKGTIVFVSSVGSVKPGNDGYAYRMSKAALSSYAKCLAVDIAPKIRVNIVSPGPIATPLFENVGLNDEQMRKKMGVKTLLNRVGESEEIANTIFYLASDEASFVNGAELFVDGGYMCKPAIYY